MASGRAAPRSPAFAAGDGFPARFFNVDRLPPTTPGFDGTPPCPKSTDFHRPTWPVGAYLDLIERALST